MKSIKNCLLLLTVLFCINTQAQNMNESRILVDGKLTIDSLYQDKDVLIIYSGILKYDTIPKAELIKRVKNWASTNFVNLKEVLVSETDDQLVLNYITSSYYIKVLGSKSPIEWYIRLVIQFKDGKIRCVFYDDGNVRMLGTQYSPFVSARTYKLKDYFKDDGGILIARKPNTPGLVSLHNSVLNTFESIKNELNKRESQKQNDW